MVVDSSLPLPFSYHGMQMFLVAHYKTHYCNQQTKTCHYSANALLYRRKTDKAGEQWVASEQLVFLYSCFPFGPVNPGVIC